MFMKRLAALCFLMPVGTIQGIAQEPFTWIGQKVVTKYKCPVKVGNQVIEDGSRHKTYTVTRAEGDWLWVVSGSIEGWLPINQVILFDQALDFYTSEIRSNPSSSEAYNGRAIIWDDKEEYDIALADYNDAIRLDPSNSVAYGNRGGIWSFKKDYDKALADYNEAIRLDPRHASAYRRRGTIWSNKKDFDRALTDFNEAIRLDPIDGSSYRSRSGVWAQKKDYDKAIADCNEAIRLEPKDGLAYACRGWIWSQKKDYEKAIADYNEAIRLDTRVGLVYRERGRGWCQTTDYKKALADFNEAIRLDPKDADATNLLAWLMATCPDESFRSGNKAVELAKRACELSEWKDASILDTLAAAHAEAGNFDKAIEWQEKANKDLSEESRNMGKERLKLYKNKKPYRDDNK
jgi:tetratricopeptide (TPR) repeat protein